MRPAAGVLKFVFAQAPRLHLGADVFRHARVGGEEGEEAADVVLMRLPELRARGVVGVGVGVVFADEVGGNRAVVVEVGLLGRDHVDLEESVQRRLFVRGGEMCAASPTASAPKK